MENQSLTLKQRSIGLIATVNNPEELRKLEKSLTIDKIIDTAIPMVDLRRNCMPGDIERSIDIQLTRLVQSLNLKWNLNSGQIRIIVEDLIEKYPTESIEDFILVFKRARMGEFGELFRLDGAVIFGWMNTYLEEKYAVIENKLHSEKDNIYKPIEAPKEPEQKPLEGEERKLWIARWAEELKQINSKNAAPITDKDVKREGQEKPLPKNYYPSSTVEQYKAKALHLQWIRENFDIISGKPKPTWISEDEFLKQQSI